MSAPVEPAVDDPVENTSAPLTPLLPDDGDAMATLPLVRALPGPDDMDKAPPVVPDVDPACTRTAPPVDAAPRPAEKIMNPDSPSAALPVDIVIIPELPLLVVPVLKRNAPLDPLSPASLVLKTTDPLLVAAP